MESSQHNSPEPIDITLLWNRFVKTLKRTWILILVLCIALAGVNLLRVKVSYTPKYRCQAIFSIGSGYNPDSIYTTTSAAYYDGTTVQSLVSAFPELLKTDYMRDMITARLDSSYINGQITASAVAGTNLMELQVTSSNAQDAYDILTAVINCYPQAAMYMADNPVIVLLDYPVLPTVPVNNISVSRSLATGAAAGLLLGLGITLVFSLLVRTVSSTSELKTLTNLPILTALPLISQKQRRKDRSCSLISAADNYQMGEALRTLRAKLRKRLAETGGKIILLTSTISGEGKTTVSANLAIALAAEGHRVVLLDADLRKQSIARLFRSTQEDRGLMYCLDHPDYPILDCLKKLPDSTLYYISGSSTAKRHYSIDGNTLQSILDTLAGHFDYVIVDTPPCSVVSDTTLLARFADCVAYIIKLDYTNQHQITESISRLYQQNVPLTGCIVNGVIRPSRHYGYGYGYGYGSKRYTDYNKDRKA